MKRDMEYVRELLLKIEEAPAAIESSDLLGSLKPSAGDSRKLSYHLAMLIDEVGLVKGIPAHAAADPDEEDDGMLWLDVNLTWRGHEFLEAVRDKEVWAKTVAGAKKVGNFGFDLLLDMAKAYGKHFAKERLGLDL